MPIRALLLVLYVSATSFALARTRPTSAPAGDAKDKAEQPSPGTDKLSVTEQEVAVNGKPLRYRATAGTIAMKDEAGKHKADVFSVSYEKLPVDEDRSSRPITFVFNGGPGAAAVWL